jgi:hypothetical protein
LETRGLYALARKEAIYGFPMDPEDPPDANGVEPAVVNQPPDRLGMNAELVRDFTDTDQTAWLWAYGRHNPYAEWQVSRSLAWAAWPI